MMHDTHEAPAQPHPAELEAEKRQSAMHEFAHTLRVEREALGSEIDGFESSLQTLRTRLTMTNAALEVFESSQDAAPTRGGTRFPDQLTPQNLDGVGIR